MIDWGPSGFHLPEPRSCPLKPAPRGWATEKSSRTFCPQENLTHLAFHSYVCSLSLKRCFSTKTNLVINSTVKNFKSRVLSDRPTKKKNEFMLNKQLFQLSISSSQITRLAIFPRMDLYMFCLENWFSAESMSPQPKNLFWFYAEKGSFSFNYMMHKP